MRRALLVGLCACAGEEETTGDPCEGAGDPVVELGEGNTSFEPWASGAEVAVEQSGAYGFQTTLRVTGVDTTAPVTAFLRFSVGDDPTTTDVGASLTFLCQDDGAGISTVFATLGDARQTPTAVAELDGEALHLTATVTDAAGDTASAELELVLSTPQG